MSKQSSETCLLCRVDFSAADCFQSSFKYDEGGGGGQEENDAVRCGGLIRSAGADATTSAQTA